MTLKTQGATALLMATALLSAIGKAIGAESA